MLLLPIVAVLHFLPTALARPTDGGSYAYDATDVVTSIDSAGGRARVWYSSSGPNVVKAGDTDGDGIPDFAETVAADADSVLATYADFGFRPLVSDGTAGGSDALDVYLVDFGGDADGNYAPEHCTANICSGYFQMENDFQGYGYSSIDFAIETLTSHELFHAVQASYNDSEDSWYAEGTAEWAENFYDLAIGGTGNADFESYCDYYLTDTGRSLDSPPAGPVPPFSYSTAIFWYFITQRYGDAWMLDYLDATANNEDLVQAIADRTDLGTDFVDFAVWNLATGSLAGGLPDGAGYDFAASIGPPTMEAKGPSLDDDQRFYPLATTYYKLEWPGGDLQFGLAADAPDVTFQLWGLDANGHVNAMLANPASAAGVVDLGDYAAGDYYFFGVNATQAAESTKVEFCLGADASCYTPPTDTGDTGSSPDDTGKTSGQPKGCGCATDPGAGGWAVGMVALGLAATRRRQRA